MLMTWVHSDKMQSGIAKYKLVYYEITYRRISRVERPATGVGERSKELEV